MVDLGSECFSFFLNNIPLFAFVVVNVGDRAKVVIHLFIQQISVRCLLCSKCSLGC